MKLIQALRYSPPTSLAFVGAGGKTSAIFTTARELLSTSPGEPATGTVLVTTTTHFGSWQAKSADHFYAITSNHQFNRLKKELPAGIVLLTGNENGNRLGTLSGELLEQVQRLAIDRQLPLLIEADGARNCSLKAPDVHEPAIPDFVESVVVVAGLQGLGKPISKEWIHRPQIFAQICGLKPNDCITSEAVIKVLLNEDGGLKNIPPGAHRLVLLNQADTPELQSTAKAMAEKLIPVYSSVSIASLGRRRNESASVEADLSEQCAEVYAVVEPIAGIILAAGASQRFGKPKQLLTWRGESVIRRVAKTAIKAGLSPIIVVVGSYAEEIVPELRNIPLRIVNNANWDVGVSSSIQAGIRALSKDCGGAVFLQADQPQIPALLIRSLVERHEASLIPITAPLIDGQRGNPVLFDASTFVQLLALEGDIGGRAIFGRNQVDWLPWHDKNLLLDIDSPEDFQRFGQIYPEGEV